MREFDGSASVPSRPGEKWLAELTADIISRKQSLLEIIRAEVNPGDYWAEVQKRRLAHSLLLSPEVMKVLSVELQEVLSAYGQSDTSSIDRELAGKDGQRRFELLSRRRAEVFKVPSLLSGANFGGCLSQYKRLLTHVESLWSEACRLFRLNNYHLSTFISILVIEEIGKLANLAEELIFYDMPRTSGSFPADRDHRRKQLIAVLSGALINERLDRVLGKKVVKKLLHEAESDEFEKTRQSCLYIDVVNGRTVVPDERISSKRAQTLVILAGELMTEVLGHFPWEFERMLNSVVAFERTIGLPEQTIVPK